MLSDFRHSRKLIKLNKRRFSCYKFYYGASERPNIRGGLSIASVLVDDLRCDPECRTCERIKLVLLSCHAKVSNFYNILRVDENIRSFDVSVNYLLRMKEIEAFKRLFDVDSDDSLRQLPALLDNFI